MKGLDQEQHIQLLQFMSLMQTCKTEEELQELKNQYYNIPRYEFLQEYILEKKEKESFSSYKTNLIYDMDKYQRDYKFVYGENFPAYKKESMPNNKTDYTVLNLLNEISECDDIEVYQKLLNEKNKFPKVKIESLSSDFTGIYFSNSIPDNMILNSPEANFNTRKQLVEAGYSPFTLPSVEDVKENGFNWLHEEISHFKETLNPNFIEMETQMNQEVEFNETEYEEDFDDFIEQMDANGGMSSMVAESDYNASYEEYEDFDFEKYIHSEEFISKFGDWEKASRLQKLSEAPAIVKNGKVIIEGEDITEEVNNFRNDKDNKVLRIFAKDIGRSVKGTYHNDDLDIDVVLSMGNIDEIKNHHMAMSGHLEAIQYIPDIIKQGIYIAEEANEDKAKHPNIEKYKYFVSALKIDGVDYTCKSAIGVDKDGNHYYDQGLSQIEKGLLLDNLSQLMSRGKSEQSITNYDKHLLRICQCPQTLYLDKELKPTKDAVKSVMEGKLYLEKDKNGFQLLHDIDKNKIIGKELSEMFKNQEKHNQSVPEWKKTLNNLMEMAKNEENEKVQNHENESELSQWYETVDWEDPIEAAEAWQNGTQEQIDYIRQRQADILDNGIESLQTNGGMSDAAFKADSKNAGNSKSNEDSVVKGEIKSILGNDFTGGNVKLTQDFQNELIEKGIVKPEEDFILINEVEAVAHGTKVKQGEPFVTLTIPVDNDGKTEFVQTKYYHVSSLDKPQSIENPTKEFQNNNFSAPRPRNVQELHKFFINNPYVSGTPVPTIAMRNEQSGHSTFIEGYEFARFEDIGKPNLAFFEEDKKTGKLVRVKPDGQTVVLTKPGFREEIDKDTGEKKLVPDDSKRKFIKISRDLYEQAIKNSEIIAKRNPKTKQERDKMIDDYREAANLDEKKQRANTASNFWHNYQAGVMTLANNKQEAMAFAKRLINEMIPSEREKFATIVRNYEKVRGSDGKHLSYDQRIINFYDNMGLKITSNSIWRDHIDDKYNTLDVIKQNTEVFDKEGQSLDKNCRMKIGDTIKMSVTVDSALSNKKIKLPIQEYRLVAYSKDNNSVALISTDGKQKIIKNRDDFIKEVQKVEKKQLKKQQKQDRDESISM